MDSVLCTEVIQYQRDGEKAFFFFFLDEGVGGEVSFRLKIVWRKKQQLSA